MASYSDLLSKAEQAGVALVNTLSSPPANLFTGQESIDKQAPCVIVEARDTIEEDPPLTGNYWIELEIAVKSMAPTDSDGVDPKAANDALVQEIFDLFSTDQTAAGLNNATVDFGCQAVLPGGHSCVMDGDAWVNTLRIRVYCAAHYINP